MDTLKDHFILPIKPKEYLKQGLSHCGAYSVKAILSAYGLDMKSHPKDYHTNWLGKITGLTMGSNYYVSILRSYGLKAETGTTESLSSEGKISFLKNLLSEGNLVMIRIGNGYMASKRYNPILGKIIGHWVTLWGYDDKTSSFYVYDSALLEKFRDKKIATGNTKRTYKEILRDWNFGKWQFWYWLFLGRGRNNVYIQVKR